MMTTTARSRYGLDHVGFAVPSLEAAVSFFTEHLDAVVEFRLDRFVDPSGAAPARLGAPRDASFALAMLRLGDAQVELLQWWSDTSTDTDQLEPPPSTPAPPHRAGATHLALSVDDAAQAYAALGTVPGVRLLGSPVTFGEGPTPGLTNAFVLTPWGLLLELMSWPRESSAT